MVLYQRSRCMKERFYRKELRRENLVGFEIKEKETDLFILAEKSLKEEAKIAILKYRAELEGYIRKDPGFKEALEPWEIKEEAPLIVQAMAEASFKAGVGPMAAVAGTLAEFIGYDLLSHSQEVIIENGGDIFIKTNKPRRMGIFAGDSSFNGLALEIDPSLTPLGVCTSSGTVSHSLSLGQADAVVVVSCSTPLADATATAIGNLIQQESSIHEGIALAKKIEGVKGVVIIIGSQMGAWGTIELVNA